MCFVVGWNGYSVPFYIYGGFETSLTLMVILFVPAASPFAIDKGKKAASTPAKLFCLTAYKNMLSVNHRLSQFLFQ